MGTPNDSAQVHVRRAGPVAVITPEGEVRREEEERLDHAVGLTLRDDIQVVIISFRHVTVLMSDGIRLLVALRDKACDAGKEFYITDLPKRVYYTLKISNLLGFLNHVDTLRNILDSLPEPVKKTEEEFEHVPAPAKEEEPVEEPLFDPTEADREDRSTRPTRPLPAVKTEPERDASQEEAEPQPAPKAKPKTELTDDELRQLIAHHLPGRLAVEMVSYFLRHGSSVVGVDDLAKGTDHKPKEIRNMAKELVQRGVFKSMGADMYNFAPEADLEEDIEILLRMWHQPSTRRRVLPLLLEAEK